MEKTPDDFGPNSTWWHSDFYEKLQSISLCSSEETLNSKEPNNEHELEVKSAKRASQNLWATGKISEPLPSGFYAVLPERRLKELFDVIPSLEELHALDSEVFGLDVVVVDIHRDKKLSMLKQLTLTLVRGLNSNPAALIKKIAGLVSDFYKRPNTEQNNMKCLAEEGSHASENQGIQMLGQIRQGSCHPRAILFKVLADTVGLDCRLVVGLPREGVMERTDSYKHMSVICRLNSLELLVDLVRHPGKLIPCSTKAILLSHISTTCESDSADYDSCDSPLEPNSPLCVSSDHVEVEGLSRTEPYIENSCWRRSRRKVFVEQRTASSSPEPPLFREHRRSILGSDRYSFKDDANEMTSSRSAGASPIQSRRRRRRCISMVPEIGDDIVRVVRAMNDTLKGKRIPREQQVEPLTSSSIGESYNISSPRENVSNFGPPDDNDDSESCGKSTEGNFVKDQIMISQRAISLPSSPNRFRFPDPERSEFDLLGRANTNHLLLPYDEWNIDFSELTVGSRVGIGFFGEVFRGVWNGTEVAVKVLLEQDLTVENIEDFCNEISILSRLRHPNVILFLGACTRPPRLSMVTEFMEMGSLYYLIHVSGQKHKISWRRRLKMLCDICRGLMCIHRMKIAHRDLKSANCLVNKHLTVKICDFGLSRVLTDGPIRDSSSAGTPEWMAPELIRNEAFTEKCDIFSLGVIMWELCTLNRPWEGVPPINVVYAIAHDGLRLEIPEGPVGKIIADCWAEPDERPSCDEILSRLLHC